LKVVIPAKAAILKNTGCRIKSGITQLLHFVAGLIKGPTIKEERPHE
jgi:hypothetical protein